MIDYDDMKNKVTLVRSKSDAPLSEISEPDKPFVQGNATSETVAASLMEPCSHAPAQFHVDEILDAEEAYVSKDLGISSKEVFLYESKSFFFGIGIGRPRYTPPSSPSSRFFST